MSEAPLNLTEVRKLPPAQQPVIRVTAMPADTNLYGDIFGGWLIDKVVFHNPVKVGDEVSIFAELLQVGRTSMKIVVEAWQRDRGSDEMSKVTEATFVFVAVDEKGRPRAVDRPNTGPSLN